MLKKDLRVTPIKCPLPQSITMDRVTKNEPPVLEYLYSCLKKYKLALLNGMEGEEIKPQTGRYA